VSSDDPENAKHEFAFDNPAFKGKSTAQYRPGVSQSVECAKPEWKDFDERLRKETSSSSAAGFVHILGGARGRIINQFDVASLPIPSLMGFQLSRRPKTPPFRVPF
jgi:hypothetical protein